MEIKKVIIHVPETDEKRHIRTCEKVWKHQDNIPEALVEDALAPEVLRIVWETAAKSAVNVPLSEGLSKNKAASQG